MEYPKIETLFDRKDDHTVDTRRVRCREFDAIKEWVITEKIDGTNIRVIFERENPHLPMCFKPLDIRGRTDNAQLPQHVLDIFKTPAFDATRWDSLMGMGMRKMIIYGEACGSKIQSGGGYEYKPGVRNFLAFDMWIDGWWLEYDKMFNICMNLGIRPVPFMGIMSKEHAMQYLTGEPIISYIGANPPLAEGIVATSYPLMHFRDGRPIKWKLKRRDFIGGKNEKTAKKSQ